MDAEAIGKIFQPFSQADETTTRRFGGTGLGLAICRELSDVMGGRITVDSKPQIGSTFSLSLPLQVGDGVAAAANVQLPNRRVRLLTRRPALEESLSRHATSFGLTDVVRSDAKAEPDDVTVLDVSSQNSELKFLLAAPQSARSALIVVATSAEVEAHDLRVLIDEKMIVLKPVHRIAFQEALATALGVQLASSSQSKLASNLPPLQGHVLLVEDEPVNAAVAEGYLAALGCTSAWVKNGTDAVARSAAERFDLILMDLNMPDMDGFAATALIRQRGGSGPRMPIVALTAHDAVNYRDKCLKADMDDILTKPYALEDCSRLLRRWLARDDEVVPPRTGAPTSAPGGTLCSIDANAVSNLRRIRSDKHVDLYSKLVELFRAASADSLGQLRKAFAAQDLPAAAGICHKLASSAANVGALEYAKQIRRLEQLCIAADRAKAIELHEALQAAHAPLLDALLGLTLRASA
jgi:two-component system sensor histidine kinase/response regulator